MITDPSEADGFRFQISDSGVGVEWSQLTAQSLTSTYTTVTTADGIEINQADRTDPYDFKIQFSPFRLATYHNNVNLVTVNENDTLFFESGATIEDQSISMGYFVNAQAMYGIPSRANTFLLNTTETQGAYRLWNQDAFDHPWLGTKPLYGAVPYIQGHAAAQDAGVAWMNSAETWVDIFDSVN